MIILSLLLMPRPLHGRVTPPCLMCAFGTPSSRSVWSCSGVALSPCSFAFTLCAFLLRLESCGWAWGSWVPAHQLQCFAVFRAAFPDPLHVLRLTSLFFFSDNAAPVRGLRNFKTLFISLVQHYLPSIKFRTKVHNHSRLQILRTRVVNYFLFWHRCTYARTY
jgi:hypothetical protein